jgi:PAS domain S-box-containing protein
MQDRLTSSALSKVLKLGWEYAQDAMVVADVETGCLVECNPALEKLTGYSRQEIAAMLFPMLYPEEERAPSRGAIQEAMATARVFRGFHLLCRDGKRVPVAISSSAPFEADGRQLSIGMFRDVSDLEEREHRLETKRWALQAYAAAALALARAESSAGLMQGICEAITRDSIFRLAWVGFADRGRKRLIQMAGAAGPAIGYMDGLEVSWSADLPSGQGPTGISFRTNTVQTLADIESDAVFGPWRDRAKREGLRSTMTVPFKVGAGLRGVLAVYASQPNAFGPVVSEAFTHLAEEIGIGLNALRREERLSAERLEREKAQGELSMALSAVVGAITTAFEMRDPYTAGHQNRVADIACAIAGEFGWPEERLQSMRVAAMVHDIGKISISPDILTKPTQLTAAEWTLIKEHPGTGYTILKDVPFRWPIAEGVRQHHERMDGSGYPRGLKGDEILPDARILAIADVVEAMASNRPYRPGLGLDAALNEIERQAGTRLDAEMVGTCISLFREKGFVLPGFNMA